MGLEKAAAQLWGGQVAEGADDGKEVAEAT